MSTTKKAFKEVEAFLRPFQNVLALKDEVEAAGSLENLIAQRQRELADAEAKLAIVGTSLKEADDEAQKRIAAGEAGAAKARAAAERELQSAAGARAKAEATLTAAQTKASQLVAEGEAAKAAGESAATAIRATADSDAQVMLDSAKLRVASLSVEADAAQAKLIGINTEIDVRNRVLTDVNAEIARLQSRFAAPA